MALSLQRVSKWLEVNFGDPLPLAPTNCKSSSWVHFQPVVYPVGNEDLLGKQPNVPPWVSRKGHNLMHFSFVFDACGPHLCPCCWLFLQIVVQLHELHVQAADKYETSRASGRWFSSTITHGIVLLLGTAYLRATSLQTLSSLVVCTSSSFHVL